MLFEKGWVGGDKLLIEKPQILKSLFLHQILKEQALGYDDAIVINWPTTNFGAFFNISNTSLHLFSFRASTNFSCRPIEYIKSPNQ